MGAVVVAVVHVAGLRSLHNEFVVCLCVCLSGVSRRVSLCDCVSICVFAQSNWRGWLCDCISVPQRPRVSRFASPFAVLLSICSVPRRVVADAERTPSRPQRPMELPLIPSHGGPSHCLSASMTARWCRTGPSFGCPSSVSPTKRLDTCPAVRGCECVCVFVCLFVCFVSQSQRRRNIWCDIEVAMVACVYLFMGAL